MVAPVPRMSGRISSVHKYLELLGREGLQDLWTRYPVRDFGRGWDDEAAPPAIPGALKRVLRTDGR